MTDDNTLLTYCLSVPTIATPITEYLWLSCASVSEIETLNLFLILSFMLLIIRRLSFKERELLIAILILKVPTTIRNISESFTHLYVRSLAQCTCDLLNFVCLYYVSNFNIIKFCNLNPTLISGINFFCIIFNNS